MQEQMKKKQQEEQQKKLLEMQKKNEENRLRMEAMKKQQEELKKKQEEEKRLKAEQQKKQLEENKAAFVIKKVLQKIRTATIQNFEEVKKELEEAKKAELGNCGSMTDGVVKECEQVMEQATKRIETLKEQQRKAEEKRLEQQKKAEEKRLEEERKKKEREEKAAQMIEEFVALVETVEGTVEELKDAMKPFTDTEKKELTLKQITKAYSEVETAGQLAQDKAKECMDFIAKSGPELRIPVPGAEPKKTFGMLNNRVNTCKGTVQQTLAAAKVAKEKAEKTAAAREKTDKMYASFKKYDKDNDSFLSRKEIQSFAKGEYAFSVPSESLDLIMRVLVEDGAKGIKKEDAFKLKVAIGIAREKVTDNQRRAEREEAERKLAEAKEELNVKVKDCDAKTTSVDEKIKEAEGQINPLPGKGKSMTSTDMMALAAECQPLIGACKDAMSAVREQIKGLSEGVQDELKAFLNAQVKLLEGKLTRLDGRVSRCSSTMSKFNDDAKKKQGIELEALRARVLKMMKYHHRVKNNKPEDTFKEFDKDKDGSIDEKEFVAWFSKCEKEPIKKEPKKEAKEEPKEGEEKKEEGEAEKKEEDDEPEYEPTPSKEELTRVFAYLDEDKEGSLSMESFCSLIRTFMKVVKETAVTESIAIKDAKTLRRLEVNEVVELLEGPVKEDTVDVMRAHIKAMKDELEGWVSIAGNQGTVFLKEGGATFKVVKDTILTDSFSLEASKESTRKLKDTTRKLKAGEIVEAREWPRKEEKSGLVRMKCKAKSDGALGWATCVGNQGTEFLVVI